MAKNAEPTLWRTRIYLIGREPAMRISTSRLALCRQSRLVETLATPLSARSRSSRAGMRTASLINSQAKGTAYVPFFPLGEFTPLQSQALDAAAASVGVTSMQLALAWRLQRSPNILLIPGTSSAGHLRENLAAATLQVPPETIDALNAIAGGAAS